MSFTDNALTAGPGAGVTPAANAFESQPKSTLTPPPQSGHPSPAWDEVRARVAAMSADQRSLAARQAEILAVAGQGLAARPYAERRAILSHMAPHLGAIGVDANQAGGFDPTDRNLAQAVGEAVILRSMLGEPDSRTQPPQIPTAPE